MPKKTQTPPESSHYRITTNKYGEQISVPVIDVRDGMAQRALALQIVKATSYSKYIRYTEYHKSPKRNKSI